MAVSGVQTSAASNVSSGTSASDLKPAPGWIGSTVATTSGPATFRHRRRKLPSGRPDEEAVTLVQPDPTWQLEYEHFTALCEGGEGNIANDLWINRELNRLSAEALRRPV